MQYLRESLADYGDTQICDLLEFGFPIEYKGNLKQNHKSVSSEIPKVKNHKGATENATSMVKYLEKESSNGAIMGPLSDQTLLKQVLKYPH